MPAFPARTTGGGLRLPVARDRREASRFPPGWPRGDDFFALSGHSLLATRLVVRIAERTGADVPLRDVFEAPVLRDQAARVLRAQRDPDELAALLHPRKPCLTATTAAREPGSTHTHPIPRSER